MGEREREKDAEELGPKQRLLLQAGSLEDHCHCPAIHLALLASEAGDQEVRGLVWPLRRGVFSFQQVWILHLAHVPGMG